MKLLDISALKHQARAFSSKKSNSGSSYRYMERQIRDPFVKQAQNEQFRSRSSFKLITLLDTHRLLPASPHACILDCGASPGGWSQVISRRISAAKASAQSTAPPLPRIISLDLLPMRPIPGVHFIQGDFFESPVKREIEQVLGSRRVGLLLSDMAPSFTGNRGTDADRTMNLCEDVLAFSEDVLAFGGNMVVKFFMGGAEPEFRARLRERFERVVVEKPEASRKQSAEQYFVCIGKRETLKGSVK
ncbi:2' O-ribose methyltransferase [Kickxella alabastrina]|nr:2' O-ribose methyltransferase [Kickxella alabastrina]